jgi:hypothetical protein
MDNNYKIIIYGKKVYREYELEHDSDTSIKVGTSKGCNIRFNKENFFGDFSFEFLKSKGIIFKDKYHILDQLDKQEALSYYLEKIHGGKK